MSLKGKMVGVQSLFVYTRLIAARKAAMQDSLRDDSCIAAHVSVLFRKENSFLRRLFQEEAIYFGRLKATVISFICSSDIPSGSKPMFLAQM